MNAMLESAGELLALAARSYLRDGSLGLTALQREERRTVIGGSDAGAIVAGGKEWPALWAQKTGRTDGEDLSTVLAVMMGHWTEPFNRVWCQMQTGREIRRAGERVKHPTIPYLAVNLDGASTTADGHPCAWQAKHVGRTGDQVTLRYTAQCTHEALCLGVDWWAMSAFVGNSRWELTEQEVDPLFAAEYVDRCAEFWEYVEKDREPPDDVPPLGVPAPAQALLTVDLRGDLCAGSNWGPYVRDALRTALQTEAAHKAYASARDDIKKHLPENVGKAIFDAATIVRNRIGAVSIEKGKSK